MAFVSYAQNFEDVMLWRALKHVENGRYIDIGASHPVIDSVSLAFHQNGWRGIHIEPITSHAQALRAARPGDVVLQIALGATRGMAPFFLVNDGIGISTCAPDIAALHSSAGFNVVQTSVPCVPLSDVLDEHVHGEVHWLKIDVEGLEGEVIRSWAPSPVRPWIVVVESTRPMTQIANHGEWEPVLLGLGYRFVYFDGLNRFYISDAHPELSASFTCGPNFFDKFVISPWSVMWQPRPADTMPRTLAAAIPVREPGDQKRRRKRLRDVPRRVAKELGRWYKRTTGRTPRRLSTPSIGTQSVRTKVRFAHELLRMERRKLTPGAATAADIHGAGSAK